MDALEYMEAETLRTLNTLTSEYAASHERGYKVATVLVAAGGAVGAYVLAKIAEGVGAATWLPLGAIAVWWFLIAAYLLTFGLSSNKLSSGPGTKTLAKTYSDAGGDFGAPGDQQNIYALTSTRMAELKTRDDCIEDYTTAVEKRAKVLNWTYRAATATPLVAALVFWLALRL